MSVIITSFRESDNILKSYPDAVPYSVSRRQPKGYFYDELPFLGAFNKYNIPLSLRRYPKEGNLSAYKRDYLQYLDKNEADVDKWLASLDIFEDIMLCCWCPHSRSTRNQMRIYLTFACHTGIIGQVINYRRPDIRLRLDYDHAINLVPEWKPEKYRIIDY